MPVSRPRKRCRHRDPGSSPSGPLCRPSRRRAAARRWQRQPSARGPSGSDASAPGRACRRPRRHCCSSRPCRCRRPPSSRHPGPATPTRRSPPRGTGEARPMAPPRRPKPRCGGAPLSEAGSTAGPCRWPPRQQARGSPFAARPSSRNRARCLGTATSSRQDAAACPVPSKRRRSRRDCRATTTAAWWRKVGAPPRPGGSFSEWFKWEGG
mmetsp:Transcript_152683/g.489686  ORF Transcript_152683/g.489686 Transcript_152683/m.489686 type:complete len:210 (+) Transcript_152683:4049-4678(+)